MVMPLAVRRKKSLPSTRPPMESVSSGTVATCVTFAVFT